MIPLTPTLTVIPLNSTLESTTDFILSCVTGSNGTTTYQFLRDNETVISLSNSTYVHQNIQTSDTGNYTCTATINGVVSLKSNGFEKAVVGKCLTLVYMPCSNKLSNIHRLFSLHIFQLFKRHERMQPFMLTK